MFPNFHDQGELFSETANVLVNSVGPDQLVLVARRMEPALELRHVVTPGPFENEASDFLRYVSRQQRVPELIEVARKLVPRNSNLQRIEAKVAAWWDNAFGTELDADVEGGAYKLQSIVRPHLGNMSMDDWIGRALDVRRAVCRIETDLTGGTGFLVAEGLVLTSKHVMDGLTAATCIFDDDDNSPKTCNRSAERLQEGKSADMDWALLQLTQPFDKRTPLRFAKPKNDDPLIVVQHPGGGKKRISQGSVKGILHPFVEHNANTDRGTSGAPCLDANWRVVAIHREGTDGTRNRAVAIGAVLDGLAPGTLPV